MDVRALGNAFFIVLWIVIVLLENGHSVGMERPFMQT
jgi:hypothetical protein